MRGRSNPLGPFAVAGDPQKQGGGLAADATPCYTTSALFRRSTTNSADGSQQGKPIGILLSGHVKVFDDSDVIMSFVTSFLD